MEEELNSHAEGCWLLRKDSLAHKEQEHTSEGNEAHRVDDHRRPCHLYNVGILIGCLSVAAASDRDVSNERTEVVLIELICSERGQHCNVILPQSGKRGHYCDMRSSLCGPTATKGFKRSICDKWI